MMILKACCQCTRGVRVVLIAAAVELLTFPLVHWAWENTILARLG